MSDPYDRVIPSATRRITPTDSGSKPAARKRKPASRVSAAVASLKSIYKQAMTPLPYKRGPQSVNAAEQKQLRKAE
jgi:hypothetical protein